MIRMPNRLLRPLALLLATAQVFLPLSANAGISQLPPLVKPNVPPNVFYTLDDSGSMLFEVMPEDLTPFGDNRDKANGGVPGKTWTTTGIGNYCNGTCSVRFSFPPPGAENTVNNNVVYSPTKGYSGRGNATVVGFGDNLTVARWRTALTNKMYYDPAVRYDPWIDPSKIDSNNPYGLPMAKADKNKAKFNPVAPTGGTNTNEIDLTQNATRTAHWLSDDSLTSPSTASAKTFFPATYFIYKPRLAKHASEPRDCTGANILTSNLNCFTKIELNNINATFAKAATRTDCTSNATSCSYDEEIQNFANWFQYYRSRILMARGGSAAAFANQPSSLRVGFGTINTDLTLVNRVSDDFSDTTKKAFITTLYTKPIDAKSTPLLKSMDEVGQYFMGLMPGYTGTNSPWQTKFGVGKVEDQASCRQNFNIFMTDGYWTAGYPGAFKPGDWDGKVAPTITSPSGESYTYGVEKPYADAGNYETLADIAFYYWSRDLRDDLPNNVPKSREGTDVAFWQHLVQFTVGLGVFGSLDPKTDLPALTITTGGKSWPNPSLADKYKVDDLWHAAVNSRGKYFSASNPNEFAEALKNALNEIAARSGDAAAIATSNNTLGAGVKLYTATYRTGDWSGRLEQKSVSYNASNPADPTNGNVSSANDWDTDLKKPVFTSRNIVTSAASGTGGLDFSYANLFSADKAKFDTSAGTYGNGTQILGNDIFNYIRGETGKEGDFFRRRSYWLGDLVNSDPQYVAGGQDHGYSFLPAGSHGKTAYQTFLNNKKNRAPTVYVGSNDGMLHAFDATNEATGGTERFAFVPKAVIGNLPELAKPSYVHRFFVDGTPGIGDAALGSDPNTPWRTILVGTTGAGAKSVFALDITNPTSFTKDSVKWERSAVGDDDLGYTIGVPQIGRLKDGRWVTVFGNGFSSITGAAVLYVVDLNNGTIIQKIPTGVGSAGSPNGLSTPKLRIGADSTIEAAYVGDIQGNLWKFDFTTPNAGTTTISLAFGNAKPLFVATNAADGSGRRQPITTQPQLYQHPIDGYMVVFGSGKIFEENDSNTTDLETLYGVWDKGVATQVTKSLLVQQVLSTYQTNFYQVTKNPVDWKTKRGWYLTLDKKAGERLVTDPNVFEDQAIFTTLIPGISTDLCASDSLSATIQISALNGAALGYQTIDTNGDGVVNTSDAIVSGRLSSSTLGTTIIRTGNRNLKLYQAASKDGALVNSTGTPSKGSKLIPTARLWRQLIGRQ